MYKIKTLAIASFAAILAQPVLAGIPEELREKEPQTLIPTIDPVFKAPDLKEADVEIRTSGAHFYKQALTSTKPRTTTTEKFIPIPGAKTVVYVKSGMDVLVNVAFTAESRCSELNSNTSNWCEVAILVDGVEAAPAASSFQPDTYTFNNTNTNNEGRGSWESHAMDRHRCVFNANGASTKAVPVEVFWKVTNFDGGNAPNFWLDDWSFTVELARGCRKESKKFEK